MSHTAHNRFSGIRQQVLLLTLLPLLSMTLLLAGYFISTRIADNEAALIERGQTMSRLMAEASEFGIISGLTHQLNALSKGPIQETDVTDVIFMNLQGSTIFRSSTVPLEINPAREPYNSQQGRYWLFLTPVITSGILVQDLPEYPATDDDRQLLGWVVVVLSTDPMQQRQYQIIANSLLLLVTGLFVTFIIAVRYGERLTRPILKLTEVVRQLQEGKLGARIAEQSSAELGSLEQGINRLGERVQASNQLLESRVVEATQRLRETLYTLETKNNDLEQARQHADQANQAKDEFLARMSHELRTPLTSILGFTNILRGTELSFEQQEHCRIIKHTSTILLSIIDDILDFARLQSDAISLESICFNPEKTIYEAVEMQSQSAAEKGLEIVYQVEADAQLDVYGDPTRLRQVATNLISNAIKFTEQGHVVILLRVIKQCQDRVLFELLIQDSGIGISAEQQEGLFNAFSQADSSITRRFGGSGLGLVIVQKLVNLMQGQVTLHSTPGKGTEVQCTFQCQPRTQVAAVPALPAAQATQVIVFDRHPASLKALTDLSQNAVARTYACGTLPALMDTLRNINSANGALIFGLSAHPDIANQQKRKMPDLFSAFKGNILLLTPARDIETTDLATLSQRPNVTVAPKPLRRAQLHAWLHNTKLDSQQKDMLRLTPRLDAKTLIVIAEDNDFNRLLLRRIIETAGARVLEAKTGEQAVQLTYQHHPDAVIMDVHMPVMDGIEATAKIREHFIQLPIIALTANVISSEEEALRAAGVSKIEYKPIKDKLLIRLLKLLCKEHPASQVSKESLYLDTKNTLDSPTDESTNLAAYQLSKEDLHRELIQQLRAILEAFSTRNKTKINEHAHQLTGLAGLFTLPELEVTAIELGEALKEDGLKAIWKLVWRLQRLIEHHQYLDN